MSHTKKDLLKHFITKLKGFYSENEVKDWKIKGDSLDIVYVEGDKYKIFLIDFLNLNEIEFEEIGYEMDRGVITHGIIIL